MGQHRARPARSGGVGLRDRPRPTAGRRTSACCSTPSPTRSPALRPGATGRSSTPSRRCGRGSRSRRRTCGTRSSTCTRWSWVGTTTATSSTRSATSSRPADRRSSNWSSWRRGVRSPSSTAHSTASSAPASTSRGSGVESLDLPAGQEDGAGLLLMNVETMRRRTHSSERYSFDAHARRRWSWSTSMRRAPQGLNTVEQWTAWLREHREALDALDLPEAERAELTRRIDEALPTISQRDLRAPAPGAHERCLPLTKTRPADPDDPGGMRLRRDGLDRQPRAAGRRRQRLLSNSVFEVKRRQIIGLDRARLLHPGLHPQRVPEVLHRRRRQQLHFWGPRDRQALPRRDARRAPTRTSGGRARERLARGRRGVAA